MELIPKFLVFGRIKCRTTKESKKAKKQANKWDNASLKKRIFAYKKRALITPYNYDTFLLE